MYNDRTRLKMKHILFILLIGFSGNVFGGEYNWPLGLNKYQEKPLSSTFMEYRNGPLHYHGGIDMLPIDSNPEEWKVYSVVDGPLDSWGNHGQEDEFLNHAGFTFIHLNRNTLLFEGAWIPTDGYLGDVKPNMTFPHLHFEEGGVFYGYRYNPLDCNFGVEPYTTDNQQPNIEDFSFYRQGSSAALSNWNLDGDVDIRVQCYDPFTNPGNPSNPYQGGVYRLGYQIKTPSGVSLTISPNWNIIFDQWTTNNGFGIVWESDNNIWVSNYLNPNSGQAVNEYWDTQLIRNGNYQMCVLASDLNCEPNEREYCEDISVSNPAQIKTSDIQNADETWYGEVLVFGHFDSNLNRNVLRVKNSSLTLSDWSRITIAADVWVIFESNSVLWQSSMPSLIWSPAQKLLSNPAQRAISHPAISSSPAPVLAFI